MSGRQHHSELYPNTGKKRRNPRKKALIGSSIGILAVAAVSTGYYELHRPLSAVSPTGKAITPVHIKETPQDVGRTNVLLIGTDTRPHQVGGNTDVLILCSIDPKSQRIEMLSIPRDTKVTLPDGTVGKINSALWVGGPQATVNVVSTLIHQPIDSYALTHFGGLVDIVNTIHGITVNVPEPMHYNTGDKQYGMIDLNPGVQTLNGPQALGFVRFREDALGDIGRTERQQVFLQALAAKLLRPSNIPQLPTLVHEFYSTVQTNMSVLQILKLASDAGQFKTYKIIHETLPGSFHNPNPNIPGDLSYWIVNPNEAKWAAQQFFDNGVVQANPVQDPSVTQNWTPPTSPSTNPTSKSTGSGNTGRSGPGTSPSGSSPVSYSVNVSSAYVRSGPGTNYSVIASVLQGQTVQVIGTSGKWDKIQLNSTQTGYIAGWLVTKTSNNL
ncbi:LCP family protein [Alicyclobacillus sp. ALC3]|uniref:LCP family protein n=1 Tax=Alicyclobacillus sp. ALC3 TaxID=2796143 RepID=UPI00237872C5|nr:LCP family protein [Alicyclobacillus sp. ALC3]WDL96871.1 LCP family protein [Alicyclobacillus sp. ALC3]